MILGSLLCSLCRSALLPFIVVTTLQISPENRTVSLVWSCDFTDVLDWLPGGDAGPIPPGSSTTRSSGSLAARCPVILMLEASKGKGAGSLLQRRGSINIGGKRYWERIEGVFWMRGSQQARGRSVSAFGVDRRESYGGTYSTVKSAQRVTLSIRPSGRVQIIDIFRGSILISKDITSGLSELASFVQQESVKICHFPNAGCDARRIAREIDMFPAERR